jgi:hypothetical protein
LDSQSTMDLICDPALGWWNQLSNPATAWD